MDRALSATLEQLSIQVRAQTLPTADLAAELVRLFNEVKNLEQKNERQAGIIDQLSSDLSAEQKLVRDYKTKYVDPIESLRKTLSDENVAHIEKVRRFEEDQRLWAVEKNYLDRRLSDHRDFIDALVAIKRTTTQTQNRLLQNGSETTQTSHETVEGAFRSKDESNTRRW